MDRLTIKELKPTLWKDVERLFGKNGACGGCWCMSWRQTLGEKWDDVKGETNRKRFERLVKSKKAHGALAYMGKEPVGWVSFDRRTDFNRLDRAPSLRCDDAEKVWSVPCFFIKSGYRNKGIGSKLLEFAVACLKKRKVAIIEGYPVTSGKDGKPLPGAFAWTGTLPMFQKAGFKPASAKTTGKRRMRWVP